MAARDARLEKVTMAPGENEEGTFDWVVVWHWETEPTVTHKQEILAEKPPDFLAQVSSPTADTFEWI